MVLIHYIQVHDPSNQSLVILLDRSRNANFPFRIPPFPNLTPLPFLRHTLHPLILMPRLTRVRSGGNTRRDDRTRERDAGSSGFTVLQLDVAIGGKEVAFFKHHHAGAAGATVVVDVAVAWSGVAGVHVEVGSSLAAGVC